MLQPQGASMSHSRARTTCTAVRNSFRAASQKPTFKFGLVLAAIAIISPLQAHASPFDTGFNNLQTLFTGTIAKVASIIAIVLGGIGFATGEPGAKKNLAGVAIGIGIATLAVNILSWLWGS
jgi:type IV secretory pathway VirB2 component (pilin)